MADIITSNPWYFDTGAAAAQVTAGKSFYPATFIVNNRSSVFNNVTVFNAAGSVIMTLSVGATHASQAFDVSASGPLKNGLWIKNSGSGLGNGVTLSIVIK